MPILNKYYQEAKNFPRTSSRYVLYKTYKELFKTKRSSNEKDLIKSPYNGSLKKDLYDIKKDIDKGDYETALGILSIVSDYSPKSKTKKLYDIAIQGIVTQSKNEIEKGNYLIARSKLEFIEPFSKTNKKLKRTIDQLYHTIKKQ